MDPYWCAGYWPYLSSLLLYLGSPHHCAHLLSPHFTPSTPANVPLPSLSPRGCKIPRTTIGGTTGHHNSLIPFHHAWHSFLLATLGLPQHSWLNYLITFNVTCMNPYLRAWTGPQPQQLFSLKNCWWLPTQDLISLLYSSIQGNAIILLKMGTRLRYCLDPRGLE